jgi:hypothetical protein
MAFGVTFGTCRFCLSLGRRGAALRIVPNKERAQGWLLAHGWALWCSQATQQLAQTALQLSDNSPHQGLCMKELRWCFGALR